MIRTLILLLGCAAAVIGAPAFVQGNVCTIAATGQVITCAFGSNVQANDLLVIMGRWDDSSSSGGPFTATFSTKSGITCSWQTVLSKYTSGQANQGLQAMYCITSSAGAETVQYSLSGTGSNYKNLILIEYSGVASFDVKATGIVTGGVADTTPCSAGPTATLAGTGELAIGFCTGWDYSQTWGTVSGWTNRTTASNNVFGVYDTIESTTAAVTFAKTLTTADQWMAGVMTFKPSAAIAAPGAFVRPIYVE